jgi:hypothetical protein
MEHPPYIGITGFNSREQVQQILKGYTGNRPLMIGVMTDRMTLEGKDSTFIHRYPPITKVAWIFKRDPRVVNLVHYRTDDPGTLGAQLHRLMREYAGPQCDGLALSVNWPELSHNFKSVTRDYRVVLEVGPYALASANNDPKKLVERLKKYEGYVTDVMLKVREGALNVADVKELNRLLEAFEEAKLPMTPGIAGGLTELNVPFILPLLNEGDLSVTAKTGLRTPNDELHLQTTLEYLNAAEKTLQKGASLREAHQNNA